MSWTISQLKAKLPSGFSVTEDGTFVYLRYRGKEVGVFSAQGVTPESLRNAADDCLKCANK